MKWTIPLLLLILVCSIPIYGFSGNSSHAFLFGNMAQIVGLICAFFSYTPLVPTYPRNHPVRRAWSQLGLGVFIWLIGQFLEIYCEMILKLIAYGTVADALWVVGYFPIIYGLHTMLIERLKEEHLPFLKTFRSILIPGLVGYLLILVFFILPQLGDKTQSWAKAFLDFFYPTFDIVMMIQCILLMRISRDSRGIFRFALISTIAFADTLVGDSIISIVKDFDSPIYLSVDVYYFTCYFLMAIAADELAKVRLSQVEQQPVIR
jgi:hypothetical protein